MISVLSRDSKLVKAELSQMSDLPGYRSLQQDPTIKILDNLPEPDLDSVPPLPFCMMAIVTSWLLLT